MQCTQTLCCNVGDFLVGFCQIVFSFSSIKYPSDSLCTFILGLYRHRFLLGIHWVLTGHLLGIDWPLTGPSLSSQKPLTGYSLTIYRPLTGYSLILTTYTGHSHHYLNTFTWLSQPSSVASGGKGGPNSKVPQGPNFTLNITPPPCMQGPQRGQAPGPPNPHKSLAMPLPQPNLKSKLEVEEALIIVQKMQKFK